MSPLPAKFNDPSSQILPKKNDGIREEVAADFYRLREEKAYGSDPRPWAVDP
jgi:hypothetical protein